MRRILALGSILTLASCGSTRPTEAPGLAAYRFDFDFVWEQAQEELKDAWRIASADRETKTIVTEWDLRMSPFRAFGERHRLVVTFTGDKEEGFRPLATQESEENGETEKPMDPEEADWSSSRNDGALAHRFVRNFDRRMKPNEAWRREASR